MINEYNRDARKHQIKGTLDTLRLGKFMAEHEISSPSTGLTRLVNHIEDLSPQSPPHARTEGNKIECLRKAVRGYKWSDAVVRSVVSSNYTFNGFVTALREDIQVENDISLLSTEIRMAEMDTLHQRNGRNPRHVQKHEHSQNERQGRSDRPHSRSFEESRKRNECPKCGAQWSPRYRCAPGAIRNHVVHCFKNS